LEQQCPSGSAEEADDVDDCEPNTAEAWFEKCSQLIQEIHVESEMDESEVDESGCHEAHKISRTPNKP